MRYNINPVPKPRMTRSDKWKKRPCVVRYFLFKDEIRMSGMELNNIGDHVVFYIKMPKSWTNKKKENMNGEYHQVRPDIDNYLKALLDALFDDDSMISNIQVSKLWSYTGGIEVI